MIKLICSFICGAAAGVAASYIFYKKKIRPEHEQDIKDLREYAKECYKTSEEMRSYAEEMYKDLRGDNALFFNEDFEVYSKNKKKKEPQKIKKEKPQKEKIDYTKYYDAQFGVDAIVDAAEKEHPQDDDEEPKTPAQDSDIFQISSEVYNDADSMYKKCDLEYYTVCGTLIKENYDSSIENGIVDNAPYLLGLSQVDKLFGNSMHLNDSDYDENTVYIRNTKLKTDFRIYRYIGSYNELVLGIYDYEED